MLQTFQALRRAADPICDVSHFPTVKTGAEDLRAKKQLNHNEARTVDIHPRISKRCVCVCVNTWHVLYLMSVCAGTLYMYIIYIQLYICVCVCMCVYTCYLSVAAKALLVFISINTMKIQAKRTIGAVLEVFFESNQLGRAKPQL